MARGSEGLNGFVDAGCTIRGELEFSSSFRLEGEIEVARCLVGGTVRGTIRATDHVVLHAAARVWADIHTPALVMEEGAFLEGRVDMKRGEGDARPADGRPATP